MPCIHPDASQAFGAQVLELAMSPKFRRHAGGLTYAERYMLHASLSTLTARLTEGARLTRHHGKKGRP